MSFDDKGFYVGNTAYIIPIEDYYFLGVLNSKLVFLYFKRNATVLGDADRGGRIRWIYQDVKKIPIRMIDFSNSKDKSLYNQVVELVRSMLNLHKNKESVITQHDHEMIQRQIDATDRQIDALVYELYGLTPGEIEIVEGAMKK